MRGLGQPSPAHPSGAPSSARRGLALALGRACFPPAFLFRQGRVLPAAPVGTSGTLPGNESRSGEGSGDRSPRLGGCKAGGRARARTASPRRAVMWQRQRRRVASRCWPCAAGSPLERERMKGGREMPAVVNVGSAHSRRRGAHEERGGRARGATGRAGAGGAYERAAAPLFSLSCHPLLPALLREHQRPQTSSSELLLGLEPPQSSGCRKFY